MQIQFSQCLEVEGITGVFFKKIEGEICSYKKLAQIILKCLNALEEESYNIFSKVEEKAAKIEEQKEKTKEDDNEEENVDKFDDNNELSEVKDIKDSKPQSNNTSFTKKDGNMNIY